MYFPYLPRRPFPYGVKIDFYSIRIHTDKAVGAGIGAGIENNFVCKCHSYGTKEDVLGPPKGGFGHLIPANIYIVGNKQTFRVPSKL